MFRCTVQMYCHNCPHPVLSSWSILVLGGGGAGQTRPLPPLIYVDHRWGQQPVHLPPCPHHYQLPWYAIFNIRHLLLASYLVLEFFNNLWGLGTGSYRPATPHRQAELVPWNRFLGSWKVPGIRQHKTSVWTWKGMWHEIFDFRLFSWISFPGSLNFKNNCWSGLSTLHAWIMRRLQQKVE